MFDEGRAWGGAVNRDELGRWYWEVAVPIKEAGDAIIGALKVVIGREHFFNSVLCGHIGRTGHVMLTDEHGVVIACTLRDPSLHEPRTGFGNDTGGNRTIVVSDAVRGEIAVDMHNREAAAVGVNAPPALILCVGVRLYAASR